MKEKMENPASEMLAQGLKNYEQALRMGLNVQEEAGKWWTRLLSQSASPQDLQKRIASLTNEAIPATQKAMESYRKVLEQASADSVELIKNGLEAAHTTDY